jgi:uncharacterized membrane protein (Fun14 family)
VSRQFDPEDDELDEEREPQGHIRNTSPGALVVFALVGLVLGWALRQVTTAFGGVAPTVGWLPVGALFFVAVIVGSVAWSTYRTLHRRGERIAPHQAVNRLVLAKACALAGAFIAGGYFGYALSWMGHTDADLAKLRVLQSVLAGLSSVLLVTGSLLLERACRVRKKDK